MHDFLDVPRQVGDCVLRRRLGRGGMGEVWLASKGELAKPCVVKFLLPKFSSDPEYRRRFFREAKILASLRHGRIVTIIDYGEYEGWLYIVMDYVDGVDLGTFCRALWKGSDVVPTDVAAYIVGEVLEAVRHAHERAPGGNPDGIIHRDITPGNVLISSEGEISLSDFGLALHERDFSHDVFGTLAYMAPEQARGLPCFESDLYGVGGLLLYMLTGRPPRKVQSIAELVDDTGLVSIETGRALPDQLHRLLGLCLAPKVEHRLPSAYDGLRLLDSWPGYRKKTSVIAGLYANHVGPRHTGTTEAHPAADEPREQGGTVRVPAVTQPVADEAPPGAAAPVDVETRKVEAATPEPVEVEVEPAARPSKATPQALWKPWWVGDDDDDDHDDDDAEDEMLTRRYLPPADQAEPDAPRLFRRPRSPRAADIEVEVDGEPVPPLGPTQRLPSLGLSPGRPAAEPTATEPQDPTPTAPPEKPGGPDAGLPNVMGSSHGRSARGGWWVMVAAFLGLGVGGGVAFHFGGRVLRESEPQRRGAVLPSRTDDLSTPTADAQ
ncbi:MAG: protein kinase [Deltaproteobacteria bacterium]|nr:protein kinase [Deltaproteobacteria bacterium]